MASYQKRGKHSFLLIVEAGYDAKGKRKKRTKTIRVEDKALLRTTKKLENYLQQELAKFQMEVEAGEYIAPEKNLLEDFVHEWHKRYAIKDLSPTTAKVYMSSLNNHILPHFEGKRIGDIKTIQIIRFLGDKTSSDKDRKDGKQGALSPHTIRKIYDALCNVFARAHDWRIIKDNPMVGVRKPSSEEKEMKYYSSEDLGDVINALNQEHLMWRVYFLGALFGGLRRGELTALEWKHILYESNEIKVENNIVDTKNGKAVVKAPKTKSSKAAVVMPEWYMSLLREWHTEWKREKFKMGEDWEGGEHQYLFHNGTGKALYFSTPTTKWRRIIEKHGLKKIRLHDLRHSMVALLMEEDDVNLPAIQKRARHSSSKITSDIYGHISKKRAKQTASQFDKYAPPKNSVNNSSTSL
ncbi:tyrosine-type recombinase/integrase [Halobacillus massiliensis]|uniref:tyrosine-type recombinase/integrase n=1 Tax=Halobacillus massiliensis TaxID=1926286 RepID=UPI0009E321DD|nr:site-specific integrase [Halobacillus massiliensis]